MDLIIYAQSGSYSIGGGELKFSVARSYVLPQNLLSNFSGIASSLLPIDSLSLFSGISASPLPSTEEGYSAATIPAGATLINNPDLIDRKFSNIRSQFYANESDYYKDRNFSPQSASFYADFDGFFYNNPKYTQGSDSEFGAFNQFIPSSEEPKGRRALIRPVRRSRKIRS